MGYLTTPLMLYLGAGGFIGFCFGGGSFSFVVPAFWQILPGRKPPISFGCGGLLVLDRARSIRQAPAGANTTDCLRYRDRRWFIRPVPLLPALRPIVECHRLAKHTRHLCVPDAARSAAVDRTCDTGAGT